MHQSLRLKTVQESRQGWPFHRNALRKLALRGVMIESGKVEQNQPTSLRQAEICEPTIQFSAPATRELCQLHREAVLVGIHGAVFPEKLIISELTTAPESRQDHLSDGAFLCITNRRARRPGNKRSDTLPQPRWRSEFEFRLQRSAYTEQHSLGDAPGELLSDRRNGW